MVDAITSRNGRIMTGSLEENRAVLLQDENFRSERAKARAARKLEKAFAMADGLGENGVKDGEITEAEIEAYNKEMKKKSWRTGLLIAAGIAVAGIAAYAITKGIKAKHAEKRWLGEAEQYIPDCSIANSQIPSHHDIDGMNNEIRRVVKLKKGDVGITTMCGAYNAVCVDNEFARLAPLEKDCIGYRAVNRGITEWRDEPYRVINNAKVGDIIVPDTGCSYAAHNIDLAERFMGKEGMMYTIRIPKGARVSRNMEHGGEILMPRGAEYKLISKQLISDGTMEVTLEYILPKSIIPEDVPQIKKVAEQYVNSTDKFNRNYAQKIIEEIEKLKKIRV